MRRHHLAVIVCGGLSLPRAAAAQYIPGRDLLEFPVGSIAEPAALTAYDGGFRNPAASMLEGSVRLRVTAAALTTSADQGVGAQLLAAAYRVRSATTISASVVQAGVADLIRTETDPQSLGGEIPYSAIVTSLGVADHRRRLDVGAAVRYWYGSFDGRSSATATLDAGFVADPLGDGTVRLAGSTFLWRPGKTGNAGPTLNGAIEARMAGVDSLHEARAGYGISARAGIGEEQYGYALGRFSEWEARLGVARARLFGRATLHPRIAVSVHYARYVIGVAREESGAGLSPTYQFVLSSVFR